MRTRLILEAFGDQGRSHSGEQIPISLPQVGRKKRPARKACRGHGAVLVFVVTLISLLSLELITMLSLMDYLAWVACRLVQPNILHALCVSKPFLIHRLPYTDIDLVNGSGEVLWFPSFR